MAVQETDEETYEETEETPEERAVWCWRFEQLVGNGYPELFASMLASARTVDLELARRLVSKLACPPELAVRILL
jgi:hypothetical protein